MSQSDPGEYLAGLVQIRDAAEQRVYISNAKVAPTADLVEALSLKIRDTAWKDPALAEALTESNLYLASLIDTPLVWAPPALQEPRCWHTMRKCAKAQPHLNALFNSFPMRAWLLKQVGRWSRKWRTWPTSAAVRKPSGSKAPARAALEKVQDTRYSLSSKHPRQPLLPAEAILGIAGAYEEGVRAAIILLPAAIGMGRAHVLTEMNRFDEALEAFKTTRQHWSKHGSLWVDIADRGIFQDAPSERKLLDGFADARSDTAQARSCE